jgi:histidinol phosphatase-like enzyme
VLLEWVFLTVLELPIVIIQKKEEVAIKQIIISTVLRNKNSLYRGVNQEGIRRGMVQQTSNQEMQSQISNLLQRMESEILIN